MTQKISLERWGQIKTSMVELTVERIELHREYYRCYSVKNQSKQEKMLWRLHGAADPFLSLIEQFKLIAIPTLRICSRQLIRFIVKSWKAYKQQNQLNSFKLELYNKNLDGYKQKAVEDEEIINIIGKLQVLKEEDFDHFAQSYQSQSMKDNFVVKQYCNQYREQFEQKLQRLLVIPQTEKMKKIENMCKIFFNIWQTELLYNRSNAEVYIITESIRKGNQTDILSLQSLLSLANQQSINQSQFKLKMPQMVIVSDEQVTEGLCNELASRLMAFEQNNKRNKCNICYPLDIENIYVQVNKTQTNQFKLISTCHLDFMQPFIQEIGLGNRINSLENLLIFFTPKPYKFAFTFSKTLAQVYQIKQREKIFQIQTAIKWLLLTDIIFFSLPQKQGKSIIEKQTDIQKIINVLISNSFNSPLHSYTLAIIDMIKLENSSVHSPQSILDVLSISNILKVYQQEKEERSDFFEQNRYDLIKNSIELKSKLFFGDECLKYFCEKNRIIKRIDSHGKYMAMYLLTSYAILQTQRQLLQLWRGDQLQLQSEKNPLVIAMAKFNKIIHKIEVHVQQIDESSPKWSLDIIDQMKEILVFCKALRGRSFGSSFQNLVIKDRELKLKEIEQLVFKIKYKLQFLFDLFRQDFEKEVNPPEKMNSKKNIADYLNGRKNICLKQIFVSLSFYNYSELFCQERSITSYKASSKNATLGSIKQEFDKIQQRLPQSLNKGKHFFQEMFTDDLSKHISL